METNKSNGDPQQKEQHGDSLEPAPHDRDARLLGMLPRPTQTRFMGLFLPTFKAERPDGEAAEDRVYAELLGSNRLAYIASQPCVRIDTPDGATLGADQLIQLSTNGRWFVLNRASARRYYQAEQEIRSARAQLVEDFRRQSEEERAAEHADKEKARQREYEARLTAAWNDLAANHFFARVALFTANAPDIDKMTPKQMLIYFAKAAVAEHHRREMQAEEQRQREPMPQFARDMLSIPPYVPAPLSDPDYPTDEETN